MAGIYLQISESTREMEERDMPIIRASIEIAHYLSKRLSEGVNGSIGIGIGVEYNIQGGSRAFVSFQCTELMTFDFFSFFIDLDSDGENSMVHLWKRREDAGEVPLNVETLRALALEALLKKSLEEEYKISQFRIFCSRLEELRKELDIQEDQEE